MSTLSITPHFVKPWLPKTEPTSYLLTNANLVDPEAGLVHPNTSILLTDGRISKIVHNSERIIAPASAIEVDLRQKYVAPGLIDSHVHISAVPGEVDFRHIMTTPEHQAMLRMTFVCRDMLSRGFTTVRDCGGAPFALKNAVEEHLVPGPRLFISGHALSQTGGHGDFRSAHDHSHVDCTASFVSGLGRVCDGVPACMATARDELRRGADFIKIMGGGGVVSPTDALENLQFSPEEIRAFVLVAANAKTYVTCHAYTPESIRTAIENGVKGIEHGNLLNRDTAKLMAKKGCYLTPTLVTYHTMADPALPQFLPAESARKNDSVLAMGLQALKIAKEENVQICYGSDLLGPLGSYQSREFSIRSEVLEPLDILRSATITPAKMLGQSDLGQVKEGFKADLLVLNSNPLEDITLFERHHSEVLAAFKDGRVWRSRMPQLVGLLDALEKL